MTPKQYLNQQETAAAFGVPRQQVARWQRELGCPCVNVTPGAKRPRYHYNIAEVAAWLKGLATGKEVQA